MWLQTNVATEKRYSVVVYGDPHMQAYKATGSVTCPALGTQTYLVNEFFQLEGTSTSANPSTNSAATYVRTVSAIILRVGSTNTTQSCTNTTHLC